MDGVSLAEKARLSCPVPLRQSPRLSGWGCFLKPLPLGSSLGTCEIWVLLRMLG